MTQQSGAIECDVVVVGAGSAGAVVANRLSASSSREVVLIEAGPDYPSENTPPALAAIGPLALLDDAAITQTYLYADLMAARSSKQPATLYRRGRGVGGSSAINGLFAVRPTVTDLDEWVRAGCVGWSFDEVLPLLNRMESDLDFGDVDYHGNTGPLPVRRPQSTDFNALDAAFRDAGLAAGHDWAPDHNAPGSTGLSPYAYNASGGRRVSTNDAYLEPARRRSNLRIVGDTIVDCVLFEGDRAVGVRALSGTSPVEIRATEVVLCAGAIHTPAVLLRSGLGPADELTELGVPVSGDLPVGLGLQDHPAIAVLINLEHGVEDSADQRHAAFCLRFDTAGSAEPDCGMISATRTAQPEIAAVIGWVNRVESTGRVRLAGLDPRTDPRVEFEMLATPVDRRRMRRVAEEMASLTSDASFRRIGRSLGLLKSPAGDSTVPIDDALSDPDFDELLSQAVFDVSHATSSCRMGPASDASTVVSPWGVVHGFQNLRVADASVLPWVPRANTHLSAVLVGEKVADDLLASLGG